MNETKKVSVIVCCYSLERFRDTIEAIDSISSQTKKPHEIIVVVDHNLELLNALKTQLSPNIKLFLSEGDPGLSGARNVGINAASGEIIAFLDDDAVAERDWLEKLVSVFEEPKVLAVGGEALPRWPNGVLPFWFPMDFDFIIGCTNHKRLIMEPSGTIRNVTGSNMAFRKEVFERIGGWDTKLGRNETGNVKFNPSGGEEAELCLRIKANFPDGIILFRPEAVIHHKIALQRATLKYVFSYSFREGITRAMIKKIVSRYKNKPLSAERLFLRQLLYKSIPAKLVRFYTIRSLFQIGVIMINLSLITIGYLLGRQQYKS
ncbi:MAG: glycosyltransferase family 2 protein [Dehalococcoidales bacterium]